MEQPKPICVIYYHPDEFGKGDVLEINQVVAERLYDYHVLAIPSYMLTDGSCEHLRLQVFHPKDFTPIEFEELKKLVLDEIAKK